MNTDIIPMLPVNLNCNLELNGLPAVLVLLGAGAEILLGLKILTANNYALITPVLRIAPIDSDC